VTVRVGTIIMLCGHTFGVSEREILSMRRQANVVLARHVAIYLVRQMTKLSLPRIGERFADRDHTTILHAVRRVERLLRDDTGLRTAVAAIERDIAALAAVESQAEAA
jgi:chromosomal replication initiator protein